MLVEQNLHKMTVVVELEHMSHKLQKCNQADQIIPTGIGLFFNLKIVPK